MSPRQKNAKFYKHFLSIYRLLLVTGNDGESVKLFN